MSSTAITATGVLAPPRPGAALRRLAATMVPLFQLPWVPLLVMASRPAPRPRPAREAGPAGRPAREAGPAGRPAREAGPAGRQPDPDSRRQGHLDWERTTVSGRRAHYGVAGTGRPVVFLHGWALGQHAYKRALKRIVNLGYRVYAPALPGFGGTADLPQRSASFAGYAEWLAEWLASLSVDEPVTLVGHSFGGGVSIKTAHDHPERVSSLVLVNAIGHPSRRRMWEWGVRVPIDLLPMTWPPRVLPSVLEDALPNLVRNPMALWRVGRLVQGCDLTPELTALRRRRLPAVAIWGAGDRVVPRASFDGLCASLGSKGAVVAGNHSWPLADPDAFAEAVAVAFERAERAAGRLGRPA